MLIEILFSFVVLSLILIAIGLFRPEHTELSLVGFVFLFLLSMVIIQGDLQHETGLTNSYSCFESNCTGLTYYLVNSTYVYDDVSFGTTFTSHLVGYWLAIASIIGFIGVLLSLRGQKWG